GAGRSLAALRGDHREARPLLRGFDARGIRRRRRVRRTDPPERRAAARAVRPHSREPVAGGPDHRPDGGARRPPRPLGLRRLAGGPALANDRAIPCRAPAAPRAAEARYTPRPDRRPRPAALPQPRAVAGRQPVGWPRSGRNLSAP